MKWPILVAHRRQPIAVNTITLFGVLARPRHFHYPLCQCQTHWQIYLCQCSRKCNNGKNRFFRNDMETAAYTFTFTFLSINWKFSFSLFFFIIIIYNLYSSPKNFQNELWWLFDMFVCLFSMLYAGYNIEWYTHRHIYNKYQLNKRERTTPHLSWWLNRWVFQCSHSAFIR